MRLEGTLDAFSLPDIFQLLSYTKKTGTLHLRREAGHGAVHLRDGIVTGARADMSRQELGRRLLGAGLVDDEALASAAELLAGDTSLSLAKLLAEKGELSAEDATALAVEQAYDAVFSLLRWSEGEFAFLMDEPDPDDLGAKLTVEDVVTEGQRRIVAWSELVESVPAPDSIVRVNAAPTIDPVADRQEWALLSLVDGHRTVTDLVTLSGRGEYAVVSALAALVGRGLLIVDAAADDQLLRRQSLLSALEGRPVEEAGQPSADVVSVPGPVADGPGDVDKPAQSSGPALPGRPEPFLPARKAEHAEAALVSGTSSSRPTMVGAHGSVDGATALKPDPAAESTPMIERDQTMNKTLLLRLIAGVRGL